MISYYDTNAAWGLVKRSLGCLTASLGAVLEQTAAGRHPPSLPTVCPRHCNIHLDIWARQSTVLAGGENKTAGHRWLPLIGRRGSSIVRAESLSPSTTMACSSLLPSPAVPATPSSPEQWKLYVISALGKAGASGPTTDVTCLCNNSVRSSLLC